MRALIFVLTILFSTSICATESAMQTQPFHFEANGGRLSGILDVSTSTPPSATIIIIPGYGKTNIVEENWFHDMRSHFAQLGINTLVWDKPGCGKSDGQFNINQPIESSATEVVEAVKALRATSIKGTDKIGIWGISRAGWIAPIAIKSSGHIDFWISASGTAAKENFRYLLKTNLLLEGRSAEQTNEIVYSWQKTFNTVWKGKTYEEYLKAFSPIKNDPLVNYLGIYELDKPTFYGYQHQFNSGVLTVDKESELLIYVKHFDELLSSLDIPVQALFGEKDTNLDWRKTAELYRKTIGKNPKASLSTKIFANANHSLKQCDICSVREANDKAWQNPYAEGYFETMSDWLIEQGIAQVN